MNDTTVSWKQDKNLFGSGSITVSKTNVGRRMAGPEENPT